MPIQFRLMMDDPSLHLLIQNVFLLISIFQMAKQLFEIASKFDWPSFLASFLASIPSVKREEERKKCRLVFVAALSLYFFSSCSVCSL